MNIWLKIQKQKKKINIFGKKLSFQNNNKSKIKFLNKVRQLAKNNSKVNLNELVETVRKQMGLKKSLNKLNNILDKKMSWKNVKKINTYPLFSIGGHTNSHPILSYLSFKDCKKEIEGSIKYIKKNTGIILKHYSYPEGLFHTYGNREIQILKKNKIKICPSAEFGLNNIKSNLFNLRRIFVNR